MRFSRAPVCPECVAGVLPLPQDNLCALCGLPLESPAPPLCDPCRSGVAQFDWARGFGDYDGNLRRLIHLLKYDGMRPLARPLGAFLVGLLGQAGPVELIVPVPLDRRRRRRRGFNQSELLAREVSRLSGVPLDAGVLRRVRHTETQTGLTPSQRRENVRGAFAVRRPEAVAGRQVLLVDDVITTGATAGACAAVLKRAGAARVVVVALARARLSTIVTPQEPPAAPLAQGAVA